MEELVVLVDQNDNPVGVAGKMEAHIKGLLHRAVSVFIFNSKGELLLQKRASSKYHSGGLWSNTCCGHPLPGEDSFTSASRRLKDEMGLNVKLQHVNSFIYKAELNNGLVEHEFDHVFIGTSDDVPVININEADEWKYISRLDLKMELQKNPQIFTPWLKLIFDLKIF